MKNIAILASALCSLPTVVVSQATCDDILVTTQIHQFTGAVGLDLRSYTGSTLHWIGCLDPSACTFFCDDNADGSITFGSDQTGGGLTCGGCAPLFAQVDENDSDGDTFDTGGISNTCSVTQANTLVLAPARNGEQAALLCRALGYNSYGRRTRSLQNACKMASGDSETIWRVTSALLGIYDHALVEVKCFNDPNAGGGGPVCFSGENTVLVKGRGRVRMDEVEVGDQVETSRDGYTEVLGWNHRSTDTLTNYLQIHHDRGVMEISKDHLLMNGKRARDLVLGDKLPTASNEGRSTSIVQAIHSVQRRGLYSPLTESGDLVVSHVLASSYVSLSEAVLPAVQHWMAHAAFAPVRATCAVSTSLCDTINQETEDGYSWYALVIITLGRCISARHWAIQWFLCLLLAPLLWVLQLVSHLVPGTIAHLPTTRNMISISTAILSSESFAEKARSFALELFKL